MPIFRRRPARRPDAPPDHTTLGDRELWQAYRSIDSAFDADDDPDGRAAHRERLLDELLRRWPQDNRFWFDRGLHAKWRRDWPASLEANRRALDLLPPDATAGEPDAWNLGIAATAVQDWPAARRAWTAFGVPLTASDDPGAPLAEDFGQSPVRLNAWPRFAGEPVPDGSADTEVVWGRRICPARIRIMSVPSPSTGHRFGDVVLHDGDPVGTRMLGTHEVSVFNEIELWERSPLPTLTAAVTAPDAAAVAELEELVDGAGFGVEDWSATIRLLCRACSEGSPHDGDHSHDGAADQAAGAWEPLRRMGFGGDPEQVRTLLGVWAVDGPGRSWDDLEVALP